MHPSYSKVRRPNSRGPPHNEFAWSQDQHAATGTGCEMTDPTDLWGPPMAVATTGPMPVGAVQPCAGRVFGSPAAMPLPVSFWKPAKQVNGTSRGYTLRMVRSAEALGMSGSGSLHVPPGGSCSSSGCRAHASSGTSSGESTPGAQAAPNALGHSVPYVAAVRPPCVPGGLSATCAPASHAILCPPSPGSGTPSTVRSEVAAKDGSTATSPTASSKSTDWGDLLSETSAALTVVLKLLQSMEVQEQATLQIKVPINVQDPVSDAKGNDRNVDAPFVSDCVPGSTTSLSSGTSETTTLPTVKFFKDVAKFLRIVQQPLRFASAACDRPGVVLCKDPADVADHQVLSQTMVAVRSEIISEPQVVRYEGHTQFFGHPSNVTSQLVLRQPVLQGTKHQARSRTITPQRKAPQPTCLSPRVVQRQTATAVAGVRASFENQVVGVPVLVGSVATANGGAHPRGTKNA